MTRVAGSVGVGARPRQALLVGGALLAAVTLIFGTSSPAIAPGNILAIGDSLTRGSSATPGHRWVDILGVAEAGHDGFTSADAAVFPWEIPPSIGIVLVEFGVNDYLRGIPSSVFEANMARLMAPLKARIVLIAAPAPLDPRGSIEPWANYVDAMRRLGDVIDMGTFGPDLFIGDGVHPNDAGNAAMAEVVRKTLNSR